VYSPSGRRRVTSSGWTIRRGNEAGLAMFTAGSLDFLTICN